MRQPNNSITCKALVLAAVFSCFSLLSGSHAAHAEGDIARGKVLFNTTCFVCHNITYNDSAVGAPGLRGVLDRHDEAWLNSWIKGPEAFAKVNDTAKALISSNKFGLVMPTLPAAQDDLKRADIIAYLKTLK